jgi:ankyrin repeat protein
VQWLLENKANPNQTSTVEKAIFKAIRNNNLEMVKLFLKHGASLDVVDVDMCGQFIACESMEMAKLLISKGADPTVRDQADFPSWYFIEDKEIKAYVENEAKKRSSR